MHIIAIRNFLKQIRRGDLEHDRHWRKGIGHEGRQKRI